MVSGKQSKLIDSLRDLARALESFEPTPAGQPRSLTFLALSKAFEVAVEYGWKQLKRQVVDEGLEALSPKDAVREAARIEIIKNPAVWIQCINARNLSVHDYFSMTEMEFFDLAETFLREAQSDLGPKS